MRFPKLNGRPARRDAFAPRTVAGPRPRLVLHVGAPKTGTTAIQFALSENRAPLAAQGVWYPPVTAFFPVDPRLASARAHFAFADAVARFTAKDQKRLSRLVEAIHARAETCGLTILSAESMYRLAAPARADRAGETGLDRRMRFLDRLATVTAGFDTEVLLYLRRVDRFAESLYAETTVQTDKTWSFEKFLEVLDARFDYRAQIDQFKARFPVEVRSFEAATDAGLVGSFCAAAGISGDLSETAGRRRPSVPNAGVLWLRKAKRQSGQMADVERTRRWHFALLPENADLFDSERRTGFWQDRATRDAFIARHQAAVSEISFPAPDPRLAPRARWNPARHAEAEQRFHAWQAANTAQLRKRERQRIPPYVLDG